MSQTTQNAVCANFRIVGMTCASCEILLERTLKKMPGVLKVDVNHKTGEAVITASEENPPAYEEIDAKVRAAGYRLAGLSSAREKAGASAHNKWLEIGGALLVIFALFKLLQTFDFISLAPSTNGFLSFGGILLIGLVAGTSSCLAVTGGLLVAVAAKYNESNPAANAWSRFKPLMQFNIGRVISYFILGGLVGVLGKSITLNSQVTGHLNILIALVMLYLALTILQIIPKGSFPIKPPKKLSHWIHELSENKHPAAPFALGGLTFFLPCGFTQSLQLVALASGSFMTGAMTMFIFSLGTLPALIGISAISSTAKGGFQRMFLTFSGALVLLLSLYNLNSAIALTGIDLSSILPSNTGNGTTAEAQNAPEVVNGVQEVRMKVRAEGYFPDSLTVKAGVPVRWVVDGTDAAGCNTSLVIPSMNIFKSLESGDNIIEFTPKKPGKLLFSCSMGMYRGHFNVL